jgi:hypothetical protein
MVAPTRQRAATVLLFAASCAASLLVAGLLWWKGFVTPSAMGSFRMNLQAWIEAAEPRRILVLGDSFLASWQMERHLRVDLAAWAAQHDVGILNMAQHGAGPRQYLNSMRKTPEIFRPELVLLFYYVGNDLTDAQLKRAQDPDSNAGDGCTSPRTTSFDWGAMRDHGIDPELVEKARDTIENGAAAGEPFNPWMLRLAMRAPSHLLDNLLVESPCSRIAWLETWMILTKAIALARSWDAQIWIVAIPAAAQLDPGRLDLYRRATFLVDDRLVGSTRPQELLAAMCREQEVGFLDLMPRVAAHGDPASLYWRLDPHFNEAGHRVVFEVVREQILDPWLAP